MKKAITILSLAALAIVGTTAFKPVTNPELELGAAIPKSDVKMMDVSGKEISLADAKLENGLLVIFSCNTCPYVKLAENRIKDITSIALRFKIGIVIVNSNEAQRSADDSFEEMKKYATAQGYKANYVVDKNSQVADAFGATRTPQCFLFDKNGLVYRGAIDDNIKDAADAKELYLREALFAVGTGKPVKTTSTKSVGCTIKRVE
ncbi:MAG: redoxin domain-containing protein [Bacteroidota bacterium]|nr:redoxin domain-containing protein [Bacteroidota bacterium]